MKNLFIPSDFSEQSLELIRKFMTNFKTQRFNIILFHTLYMPDSITDLLFISKKNQQILTCSKEFSTQCSELKVSYAGQINSIQQTLIYGSTARVFKQYLDANAIDFIVWERGYNLKKLNKYSFDPAQLILNSGVKIIDLDNILYNDNVSGKLANEISFSIN